MFLIGVIYCIHCILSLVWHINVPANSISSLHNILSLSLSCWLSTNKGVIWAFVGPMLFIFTVSSCFLLASSCREG